MSAYPHAVQQIKELLTAQREAGIPLNSVVIHSLMLGIIKVHCPAVLRANGGPLHVTRRWCRWWVCKHLKWSFRRGTTAAQKTPKNHEQLVKDMVHRVALLCYLYKIPAELVINWDQTGIHIVPTGGERTYALQGSKDICIAAEDDKRRITAVLASALSGDLLPIQLIFKGKIEKSLPPKESREAAEAAGWHLTLSENHWSTGETMEQYVEEVIVPYVESVISSNGLPPNQAAIVLIDCWSVHKGEQFRSYLSEKHPHLKLLFVPGGCTGIAQPADVILQRPFKHVFKQLFNLWAAAQVEKALAAGMAAKDIKLNLGMPVLRPLIVEWLLESWRQLKQEGAMIKAGWKKCGLEKALTEDTQREAVARKRDDLFRSGGDDDMPFGNEEVDSGEADVEDEDIDMPLAELARITLAQRRAAPVIPSADEDGAVGFLTDDEEEPHTADGADQLHAVGGAASEAEPSASSGSTSRDGSDGEGDGEGYVSDLTDSEAEAKSDSVSESDF